MERTIKTRFSKYKIPKCLNGKRHKWKGSVEAGICSVCGYDCLDECYKEKQKEDGK